MSERSEKQLKSLCDRLNGFCEEENPVECKVSYDREVGVAQIGLTYDREVPIGRESAFWEAIDEADALHVESRDDYGEDGVQISFDLVCE